MLEDGEIAGGNAELTKVDEGSNACGGDDLTLQQRENVRTYEEEAVFVVASEQVVCAVSGQTSPDVQLSLDSNKCGDRGGKALQQPNVTTIEKQDACEDGGQTSSAVVMNMDSDKCGNRGGKAHQQTNELMQNLNVIPSLNANGENVKTMVANEQQMETNPVNGEGSGINAALIHTISKDLQHINDKLQIELDGFESNSKQYHGTLKTMNDFKDFKERNKLDQLDKPRLLGVADLVKQMVASVNIRGQTTPTSKCKNPYAHIVAPAAYKERPPDPVIVPVAVNSNEKAKSNPHITRSRKKEKLRNLQENG